MKTKKAKRKARNNLDDLVQSIGAIAKSMRGLARQAEAQYAVEVENIIEYEDRDANRIQHLLDHILDFCFDDGMLALYKKLCRYYFPIDPESTVFYINAYREMWDEESLRPKKIKKIKRSGAL